jgi:hypothetical protein
MLRKIDKTDKKSDNTPENYFEITERLLQNNAKNHHLAQR